MTRPRSGAGDDLLEQLVAGANRRRGSKCAVGTALRGMSEADQDKVRRLLGLSKDELADAAIGRALRAPEWSGPSGRYPALAVPGDSSISRHRNGQCACRGQDPR